MKKLLCVILLVFLSNSLFASGFNCKTEYSKVSQAVEVFYKALGDEPISADEEILLEMLQVEMGSNVKLQSEIARVTKVLEAMISASIEINPKDQFALIAGAYYRSCK